MATTNIAADIQNITGVTTANAQFLISAQKFVVSSVPKNLLKWSATATVPSNHGGNTSDGVKITVPIGTDSILDVSRDGFSVTEVPYSEKGFISNTASLRLATNTYPKYYLDDANPGEGVRIIVKPIPTDSATAIALYVDYSKIDDDCDLRNAVVFHATSSEFSKLSSTQLPILIISLNSVPPDTPSISTVSYSGPPSDLDATSPTFETAEVVVSNVYTGSAPTYTKPGHPAQVAFSGYTSGLSETDPGVFSISAVPPDTPTIPDFTFSVSTALPSYTSPTVGSATESLTAEMDYDSAGYGTDTDFLNFSKWFSVAGEFIEDEEDSELAASQLNKISTYISSYSQAMQDKLNSFNTKLQTYQAELQKELQEAQYEQQSEHQAQIQQYQAEVGAYSADVNKEVQEYQQKLSQYNNELNMSFQAWSKTESDNISVFQTDITNELNEYNKELALYQTAVQESMQEIQVENQVNIAQAQSDLQVATGNEDRSQQRQLQNAVNDMQSIINDNNSLIQKYQAEVAAFSAEVNKETQEYQAKLQISQMYGLEADKYYKWAQTEVSSYVQNNSKMISAMMQSKASQKD
jgi:hypothetical protein